MVDFTQLASRILIRRIRWLLGFFVVCLVVSGLTAIPLEWETALLRRWMGDGTFFEQLCPAMAHWITLVHTGLHETYRRYPFIAYGTDWLAFGHIAIAIAFWGPLKDPVRNVWVIEFGMVACVLVVPMALLFAPVRAVPWFWWPVDCAFGVCGFLPLWLARSYTRRLETLAKGLQAEHVGH